MSVRRLTRACATTLAVLYAAAAGSGASFPKPAADLRPGDVVERDIAPGAPQTFDVPLAANQVLDLTVTDAVRLRNTEAPDAIEAVVRRADAAANVIRVATDTAPDGAKRVCVVADAAGTYSVVVSAAHPMRYRLRVDALRSATDADRRRARALADFVDAERLRDLHQPDRDRDAAARFESAASGWTEAGDRLEAAHAWHRLAVIEAARSEFPASLEADDRAAGLGRALGDRRLQVEAINHSAITELRLGDYPAALRRFELALPLVREEADPDDEAYTLVGMGVIYQSMGDAEKALRMFPTAIANWKANGNRAGEALGHYVTGTALRVAGKFEQAKPALEETLAMRRAMGHRVFVAASLAQLGHTYLSLGDVGAALRSYQEAILTQRSIGDWRGDFAGVAAMGTAARRGDWPAGVELFATGAAIFQVGERGFEARLFLTPLSAASSAPFRPEDGRRGIEVLSQARALLRAVSNGRWSAVVDTAIANLYIALGEPQRALETFPVALETFRGIRDRDGEATALFGLSLAEGLVGRIDAALGHAEESLRVIESFQADVADPEVRQLYLSRNRIAYALYIDLQMQLAARDAGAGHVEAALVASERARARGLIDLLSRSRARITSGVDPDLLAREQRLTHDAEQAADQLTRLLNAKSPAAAVQDAERTLDGRLTDLRAVREQLRVRSPRYAALTQPAQLDVPAIQRLLDGDTVLVEYSLGTLRSFAWIVTNDSVTSEVLTGRGDIEQAARRAYELLETGARRETRLQTERALAALADRVLAPIAGRLTRRRVVIVPDAGLHYVPFAALPMGRAPLVVDHEVVMLPSVSALAALRQMERPRQPTPRELAVFADPVLNRDFDPLPYTRAEARAIASLVAPDRAFTAFGLGANRAAALAEAGSARIVHFATHALVDSAQPEESGIVLSLVDPSGAPADGILKLPDIYNLSLNADLVVLSACRTALGKELRGEGLVGLTRAFFYAGAPAVVASLWDIRDRATAEFMTRFYRAMLRDRLAPAAALRRAQVSMLRDARWSAPANWSGFILRGDWAAVR